MARTDYYSVLGVPRDATTKQLKERFRALVRERHPDRFHGAEKADAEAAFQSITEAFNILTDPERRRQHDESLKGPAKQDRHNPLDAAKLFVSRGLKALNDASYLDAAGNFNRAVEIDPNHVRAWFLLARTAMREERWLPKAREAIDRALSLSPEESSYAKLAGEIYERSGRKREARAHYKRALELGASGASIREALERLGGAETVGQPGKQAAGKPRSSGFFGRIRS